LIDSQSFWLYNTYIAKQTKELKMANQNNTTAWAYLTNAKYIDMIMYSLKEKENTAWAAVYDAAYNAAYDAAWVAAWDAAYTARGEAWNAIYDAADDVADDAVYNAAYNAVRALIAWDDCGYLLEEKPEDVKKLALLGNQAALLLYPACVALQQAKELENNVTFD